MTGAHGGVSMFESVEFDISLLFTSLTGIINKAKTQRDNGDSEYILSQGKTALSPSANPNTTWTHSMSCVTPLVKLEPRSISTNKISSFFFYEVLSVKIYFKFRSLLRPGEGRWQRPRNKLNFLVANVIHH